MRILVDAMGGDNAPQAVVMGCMDAIREQKGFDILLIGDKEKIQKLLNEQKYSGDRISIRHTTEVITNDDMPTKAIKSKKDSSMVVGLNMLKENKGDVFLSAGNTGALLAGGLFILGRIKGVDRPALAPVLPSKKGGAMLIDAGANTVCKPINLLQFGIMGSIFMKNVFEIDNPRIGLINVGTEEKKGNELIKQAFTLLSNSNKNFIGNIEGQKILKGSADVVVCDGFVGNVLLKFLEGVGPFVFDEFEQVFKKNIITKIAYLMLKRGLRKFKKSIDPSEYGGAPFLGVKGKVMKAHGGSNAKAIKNAVFKAYNYGKTTVVDEFEEEFKNMEVEDVE